MINVITSSSLVIRRFLIMKRLLYQSTLFAYILPIRSNTHCSFIIAYIPSPPPARRAGDTRIKFLIWVSTIT